MCAGCHGCLPRGMELAGSNTFPAELAVEAGVWLPISMYLQNRGKNHSLGATIVLGFRDIFEGQDLQGC